MGRGLMGEDYGAKSGAGAAHCVLEAKLSESETRSLTQTGNAHEAEEKACEMEELALIRQDIWRPGPEAAPSTGTECR